MKLSICSITYNHGKFVRQALDSMLMQNVGFDYEIIVADDCSSDDTREILKEYQHRYPGKIRLILHEKNIGVTRNFKSSLDAASGQYVAICEGDDYWIDPNKVQRQVDFLDTHPDYAICFHKAKIDFYEVNPFDFKDYNESTPETTTIYDLIKGNYIHTPTCVYRNGLFGKYPDEFLEFKFGDWPLNLLNALHGKIYFIPEELGAYRVYANGVWSLKSLKKRIKIAIQFLKEVQPFFPVQYAIEFKHSRRNYTKYLVKQYFHRSEWRNLFKDLPQILKWYFS